MHQLSSGDWQAKREAFPISSLHTLFINMSTHWLGLASAQESLHKVVFPVVQCRLCADKLKILFELSGEVGQWQIFYFGKMLFQISETQEQCLKEN